MSRGTNDGAKTQTKLLKVSVFYIFKMF